MKIESYLDFDGRCEEAIEFYKKALGAKVDMLMRLKDSPEPPPPDCAPAGSENKVMHASLSIGDSRLMMSDGRCAGKANFKGITLAVGVSSDAEAKKHFDALASGGNVTMPLTKTFFSSSFGMLTDRFGVSWMVNVNQ